MSTDDILSKTPPPADARIAYGSDPHQFGDLRIPKGPDHYPTATEVIPSEPVPARGRRGRVEGPASPLAIVIHGGFWRARYDLVHAGHLCAALTKAGIATWNLEYRRVGDSGGGWPGSLQDIAAAVRFVPRLAKLAPLDTRRVIVIGHSAGGHLALTIAAHESALDAVIALAPISDLRRAHELHLSNDAVVEFLGGTPSQVPEHYSQASPMELEIASSQILIHGKADDIVPIAMSRSYVEHKQRRKEKMSLEELECGHFELIDPSSTAWEHVQRAALSLLGI